MNTNDQFSRISHSDVCRYLKSKNWEKVEDFSEPGLLDAFKNDNQVIEVVVDEALPSYRDRLRQTVISLAHVENRRGEDLVKEIENSHLYSIRVKADTPEHKIRLDESISMRSGIQRAFLAAAHSTMNPSIDIQRMSAKDAKGVTSSLFDDQTEAASYIANFRTHKYESGDLESDQVLHTFKKAILAIKEASIEDIIPGKSRYQSLAEKGVSKQFLENIRQLDMPQSQAKAVTIEIVDKLGDSSPVTTTFEESDFSFIREFLDTLSKASEDDDTISGAIVACSSPGVESGGEVTVSSIVESSPKRVKVRLDKVDFDRAASHFAQARKDSKEAKVEITGLLRVRERSTEMVDVSKIDFIPD